MTYNVFSGTLNPTHFTSLLLSILWSITVSCHRSPWTNQYDPPLEDGTVPSEKLRKLEIEANSAFDQFREM